MGIYLKNGTIEGDSVAASYEGQIDCDSWAIGAMQSTNMHQSTGGASGGSDIQDLMLTKKMDKSSPLIYRCCCEGTHLGEVTLTCTRSQDNADIKWLEIILTEAIISSISSNSGADGMGGESVTLNFAEYMMKFYPQEDAGAEGSSVDHGYNIATRTRL